MTDILVPYASTHGHTGKIAARIADTLLREGAKVEVYDLRAKGSARLSPVEYDAVVAGGSIHAGHYQRELLDWCTHHAAALNGMPTAFFGVCLAAAEDTEESRAQLPKYLADLEEATGWSPRMKTTFAGALQYREYDFMTRLAMRLMMKRGGHPTEVSRDYDYTDWDDVERWARKVAAMVHEAAGVGGGAAAA